MTCAYCLENRVLRDEQVLVRAEHVQLSAPRGQVVEGYLAVVPYRCVGCLAHLPAGCFAELARLLTAVQAFYAAAYGVTRSTIYEQGRAGGGATTDEAGGFPLHAHLCCLPLTIDLHAVLARERDYLPRPVAGPHELAAAVEGEPYLYVEADDRRCAYVARSAAARHELARESGSSPRSRRSQGSPSAGAGVATRAIASSAISSRNGGGYGRDRRYQ